VQVEFGAPIDLVRPRAMRGLSPLSLAKGRMNK
jgi:hypothetical protein